jgi:hypothetical protein
MVSVAEIRERIAELLMRKLSLDDFEDWFASERQDIHQHSDDQVKELAYSLDSVLSQFDSDSDALRQALLEAVFEVQEHPFVNRYGESISSSESNVKAANQLAVA